MPELVCDVLLEEDMAVGVWWSPPASVARWRQVDRGCVELLSRPDYMVGSDSISSHSWPHPRTFGCFPRFLRLLREHPVMTVEQMIQRMSNNPAQRFGLKRRGLIRKGYYADIVIFDPERVTDTATYDNPTRYPLGIPYILVNGEVAVDRERCTGVMAGKAVP